MVISTKATISHYNRLHYIPKLSPWLFTLYLITIILSLFSAPLLAIQCATDSGMLPVELNDDVALLAGDTITLRFSLGGSVKYLLPLLTASPSSEKLNAYTECSEIPLYVSDLTKDTEELAEFVIVTVAVVDVDAFNAIKSTMSNSGMSSSSSSSSSSSTKTTTDSELAATVQLIHAMSGRLLGVTKCDGTVTPCTPNVPILLPTSFEAPCTHLLQHYDTVWDLDNHTIGDNLLSQVTAAYQPIPYSAQSPGSTTSTDTDSLKNKPGFETTLNPSNLNSTLDDSSTMGMGYSDLGTLSGGRGFAPFQTDSSSNSSITTDSDNNNVDTTKHKERKKNHHVGSDMSYMNNYYSLLNANNPNQAALSATTTVSSQQSVSRTPELHSIRYDEHGEPLVIPNHESFGAHGTTTSPHYSPVSTSSSSSPQKLRLEKGSTGNAVGTILNRNGDGSNASYNSNNNHKQQQKDNTSSSFSPQPDSTPNQQIPTASQTQGPPSSPSNKWLSRQKQFNSALNVIAQQGRRTSSPSISTRTKNNQPTSISGLSQVGGGQQRKQASVSTPSISPDASIPSLSVSDQIRLKLNSYFSQHFTPTKMLSTLTQAFQFTNETHSASVLGFNSVLSRTFKPTSDLNRTTVSTTSPSSILTSDLVTTLQNAFQYVHSNDEQWFSSFFPPAEDKKGLILQSQSTIKTTTTTTTTSSPIIIPSHLSPFVSTIIASLYRIANHMSSHYNNLNRSTPSDNSLRLDDQYWLSWGALYLLQQVFPIFQAEVSLSHLTDGDIDHTTRSKNDFDDLDVTLPPELDNTIQHQVGINLTKSYNDNDNGPIDLFANASTEFINKNQNSTNPYYHNKPNNNPANSSNPMKSNQGPKIKTMVLYNQDNDPIIDSSQDQTIPMTHSPLSSIHCQFFHNVITFSLSSDLDNIFSSFNSLSANTTLDMNSNLKLSTIDSTLASLHFLLDYITLHSPHDMKDALRNHPIHYISYIDDLFTSLNMTKPLFPLTTPPMNDLSLYMTALDEYTSKSTQEQPLNNLQGFNFTQRIQMSDYVHHTMAVLHLNRAIGKSTTTMLTGSLNEDIMSLYSIPTKLPSIRFCTDCIANDQNNESSICQMDNLSQEKKIASTNNNQMRGRSSFTLHHTTSSLLPQSQTTIPFQTLQDALPSPTATPMPEFGDFGKILLDQQGFTSIFTDLITGKQGLIPGLPATSEAQDPTLSSIALNSQSQANNIANNIDLAAKDQSGFGTINDQILSSEQRLRFSLQQQSMLSQMMSNNPQVARHFENSPTSTLSQAAQSSANKPTGSTTSTSSSSSSTQKQTTAFITLRTRPTETVTESTKALSTPCRGRIDSFQPETPTGSVPTEDKIVGYTGEIDAAVLWSQDRNSQLYTNYFTNKDSDNALTADYIGREQGLYSSLLDSLTLRDRGSTYNSLSKVDNDNNNNDENLDYNLPVNLDVPYNHPMSPFQINPQTLPSSLNGEWVRNLLDEIYVKPPFSIPVYPEVPIIDKIINAPSQIIPNYPPRTPGSLPSLPTTPSTKDLLDRILNFDPKNPPDYSTIFDPFNPIKNPNPLPKPPQFPSFPGLPDAELPTKVPLPQRPPLPTLPPLPPIPELPGLPGIGDYLGPVNSSIVLPPPDIMLGMMTRMFDIPLVQGTGSSTPANNARVAESVISPTSTTTSNTTLPSPFDFNNYLRDDTHFDLLEQFMDDNNNNNNNINGTKSFSVGDIFFQATNALLQNNLPSLDKLDEFMADQKKTDGISTLSINDQGSPRTLSKSLFAHNQEHQSEEISLASEHLKYHLLSILRLVDEVHPRSALSKSSTTQSTKVSTKGPSSRTTTSSPPNLPDDSFTLPPYHDQPESRVNQGVAHQFKRFEAQLQKEHKGKTMRRSKTTTFVLPGEESPLQPSSRPGSIATASSTASHSSVVAYNHETQSNQKLSQYHRPVVSSSGSLQSTNFRNPNSNKPYSGNPATPSLTDTNNSKISTMSTMSKPDGVASRDISSRPTTQPKEGYQTGVYDSISQRQMARSRFGLGGEIGTRRYLAGDYDFQHEDGNNNNFENTPTPHQASSVTRNDSPDKPISSDLNKILGLNQGINSQQRTKSSKPSQQQQQRRSLIQNLRQSYNTDQYDRFSTITSSTPPSSLSSSLSSPLPLDSHSDTPLFPTIVSPPSQNLDNNFDLIRTHSRQIKRILSTHFSHITPLQSKSSLSSSPSFSSSPLSTIPQLRTLQALFTTLQSSTTGTVARTTTTSSRLNACSLTINPNDGTVMCDVTSNLCPKAINPLSNSVRGGSSFSTLSVSPASPFKTLQTSQQSSVTPLWGLSRPNNFNPQNSFFLTESMTNINYDLDYASVNTFPYSIAEIALRNFSPFEQFTSAKTAKRLFNTFIFRWSVGINPIFTFIFDSIPIISLGPIAGIFQAIINPIIDVINGLGIPGLNISPLSGTPRLSLNQFTVEIPFVWSGSRTVTEDSEYVSSYSITSPPSTHIIGRAMALVGRTSVPFSLEVTRRVFVPAGVFGTTNGQIIDFDYSIPGVYEGAQLLNSEYLVDTL